MMKRFISLLLCTASIVPANAGQDDVMLVSEPHRLSVRSRSNSVSCGSSAVNLQREALVAYAVQKRKADAEAIQGQKMALDAYASRKEEQELRQAIHNSLAAQKEQELRNVVNKFAEEYELKQAIQNSLNTHKEEVELKQAIQNSLNTHKEEVELKQAIQNSLNTHKEEIELKQAIQNSLNTHKEEVELKQAIQNSLNTHKEEIELKQAIQNSLNTHKEEVELKQAIQNSLNTHKEEIELKQAIQNSLNTHKEEEEFKQAIQNSYQTFQEEVDVQHALLESLKTEKVSKVQKVKLVATDLAQGKLNVNPQVQLLPTVLVQGKLNVNSQVQLLGTELAQGNLIEDEDVLKARLSAAQQELESLEAEIEFDQLIAEHGADLTTDEEDVSLDVVSPLGRDVTTDDLQALLDTLSTSQPYSPQPQTAFVKLGEAELAKGRFVAPAPVGQVKSNAVSYKSGKNQRQAELEALNAGSLFEEVTPEPEPAQAANPAPVVPVKSNAVSYKSGKNQRQGELEALNAGSLFEEVTPEPEPAQVANPAPVVPVKSNAISYKSGKNKQQAELEALNAGSLFEQPAEKDLVAVGKVVQTATLLPLEEAPQLKGKEVEFPTVRAVSKMGYTPSPMAYENAVRFVAKPATTERTEKKRIVIDQSTLAVQKNNLHHVEAEKKTIYKPVEQKVFEDIKNIGKVSLRSVENRILPAKPLKPKAKKVLSQEELIDRALHSIILKRDVSMRQGTNRAELSEDIAITMETLRELLGMSTEQVENLIKEKRWEINNGKKALKQ